MNTFSKTMALTALSSLLSFSLSAQEPDYIECQGSRANFDISVNFGESADSSRFYGHFVAVTRYNRHYSLSKELEVESFSFHRERLIEMDLVVPASGSQGTSHRTTFRGYYIASQQLYQGRLASPNLPLKYVNLNCWPHYYQP